jgi:hypothetical protein
MYLPATNALGFSTNGTNAVYIDASQNVGIGTTTPTAVTNYKTLNINGTTGGIIYLKNNGTNVLQLSGDGSSIVVAGLTNIPMLFSTNSAEAMRITSGGSLLVGTTTPTTAPAVGCQLLTGSLGQIAIGHDTSAVSGNFYASFAYNSGVIGTITQSGTTAVLYNVTSDQRLKENIQDADSASALIDSLQVRKFDWKTDNTHQRYGFVAQELVTVAPEAVHQPVNEEDMMAVDYSKLVPMLVKEIQSLRKRLADAGIA